MRTEPKSRILEALSKFAEASRRGTGFAIGDPEQSSPSDHSFRSAGAPELLCSVAVVIAEQARLVKYSNAQRVSSLHVYHHHERNHPGKENLLLFPASNQLPQSERKVRSRERLGRLLRFYHREAA